MNEISWFKFENKDLDFPVYKKNPYISKLGWVALFFAIIAGFICQVLTSSELINSILFCLIILIPLLFFLKWDYKTIFQKPKAKEVFLAVALFAGYIIYSIIFSEVVAWMNIPSPDVIDSGSIVWDSLPPLVFSLMGEEFIKLIPFLFFLRIFYKYSNKRRISVILSMLLVMVFFAFLHLSEPEGIISVLIFQGFGSIFEFIGYIKTKNVFISYITHLCTDVFLFTITIVGFA